MDDVNSEYSLYWETKRLMDFEELERYVHTRPVLLHLLSVDRARLIPESEKWFSWTTCIRIFFCFSRLFFSWFHNMESAWEYSVAFPLVHLVVELTDTEKEKRVADFALNHSSELSRVDIFCSYTVGGLRIRSRPVATLVPVLQKVPLRRRQRRRRTLPWRGIAGRISTISSTHSEASFPRSPRQLINTSKPCQRLFFFSLSHFNILLL